MPGRALQVLGAGIALLLSLATANAAEVSGFRVWADPDKTRAVLDLSANVNYQLFTLDDPHRVVIDLPGSSLATSLGFDADHAGVIQGVRHGAPKPGTLRVVLDLVDAAQMKSFLLEPAGEYGHRLVLDLYGTASKIGAAPREVKRVVDVPMPNRDVVVAIDPGHGGEDPGAIGQNRTREKDVVLQIAQRVKSAIDAEPGMRAVLVRDGDYYLPHRERYEKARRAQADLFLSVHADAFHNRSVSGASVFVLSQRGASSEFARLIADQENRADLVGGVSLADKDDMLATVLLDLSQSATMEASNAVAESILRSLKGSVKTHKPHVGRANFLVLKSPDVPSVLVETAFISNPSQERALTQLEFQRQTARAIADGVRGYFYRFPPPGTWIAANRGGARHVVSRGDTLGGIATRYRVSLNRLRSANNLVGDVIHPGTELVIPTG